MSNDTSEQLNIHTDPLVKELMRRHAFERGVSVSKLASDILRIWLRSVTDIANPIFNPVIMETGLPSAPINHRPGYTSSLGFTAEDSSHESIEMPLHTAGVPLTEDELAFAAGLMRKPNGK